MHVLQKKVTLQLLCVYALDVLSYWMPYNTVNAIDINRGFMVAAVFANDSCIFIHPLVLCVTRMKASCTIADVENHHVC